MTTVRSRSSAAGPIALGCAAVLAATSMLTSAFVFGMERFVAQVVLLAGSDLGWIMSGTGQPDPTVGPYLGQVEGLYLQPPAPLFAGQPTFDGYTFTGLTTPEQFCPFVCLPPPNPQLNFGDSLAQGEADLTAAIVPALQGGDNVTVFGYSQSADITSQVMSSLIGTPDVNLANLHVVLIGDPQNPIGGLLDRLQFPDGIEKFSLTPAPQHLPFVNIPLSMPPTPTTPIPTAIYTGEYDGWGNFPQDPSNLLGDLNALIGILTVHPFYPDYTPDQLASTIDVGTIGDTNFYLIPQNLPILQFMFNGGTAGQFFGDSFSPWARLVIDWGYGNAGDPAVDGLYPIPAGPEIAGSPYQQAFGVAGGPWAETPLGTLYDGSGVIGFGEKMDPLQLLAGVDNALIQSLIGPWADVAAGGGTLSPGDIATIDGITTFLQNITGYNLINAVDHGLLTVWNDVANALSLGAFIGPDAVLDGPVLSGQPLLDLVGVGFDVFNFFGA